MHLIRSIVLSTIVASLGSTSLASSDFHELISRSHLESLLPRHTSSPCLRICESAEKSVKACKTVNCLCTTSNAEVLQSAINCVITNYPNSTIEASNAQKIISLFHTGCANFTGVPSLSVPSIPAPSTTQTSLPVTTPPESTIPTTPTVSQTPSTPTTAADASSTPNSRPSSHRE